MMVSNFNIADFIRPFYKDIEYLMGKMRHRNGGVTCSKSPRRLEAGIESSALTIRLPCL